MATNSEKSPELASDGTAKQPFDGSPEQPSDGPPIREKESVSADSAEVDFHFPGWWRLGLVTVALSLAVFCMALVGVSISTHTYTWYSLFADSLQDNTIIATAIPRITDDLKSLDDIGWYGSVYLFGIATFQLMYGKWYTFYPAKWVFLIALFLFELGSLVCGVAPTSAVLIVGRAIASVGAAGVFAGAILIISTMVPLRQRSMYTSILVAMYGLASVAGPL